MKQVLEQAVDDTDRIEDYGLYYKKKKGGWLEDEELLSSYAFQNKVGQTKTDGQHNAYKAFNTTGDNRV